MPPSFPEQAAQGQPLPCSAPFSSFKFSSMSFRASLSSSSALVNPCICWCFSAMRCLSSSARGPCPAGSAGSAACSCRLMLAYNRLLEPECGRLVAHLLLTVRSIALPALVLHLCPAQEARPPSRSTIMQTHLQAQRPCLQLQAVLRHASTNGRLAQQSRQSAACPLLAAQAAVPAIDQDCHCRLIVFGDACASSVLSWTCTALPSS